jgi:predicted dehydrogenase
MSHRKLRWGVMSTANIGRKAVNPAIQASSNGELLAIASRDAARARTFAEQSEIPRHYGSYEELLRDDEVEAVYIPLPNSEHCPWTIAAAEAGKHVLCEKPLALSAAECDRMQAAADAHNVKLMEAFMYRFHPRTDRVLERIRDGAIGPLKAIRSTFTFRLSTRDNIRLLPELGGGSLMDVGCYCVNVSRTMAGEEPTEVLAIGRWGDTGVDEELTGILRFPNGVVAHFDCSLSMQRCENYTLAGTDGHLDVPSAFLPGADECGFDEVRSTGRTEHRIDGADEYRLMVEHFADCALHDRELRYSAAEAAANMRVIEALLRSAREGGRAVEIAHP